MNREKRWGETSGGGRDIGEGRREGNQKAVGMYKISKEQNLLTKSRFKDRKAQSFLFLFFTKKAPITSKDSKIVQG